MASHNLDLFDTMTADDHKFFVELGKRIAALRKEQGLTQQVLAEQLGIAQQTLAHYEVGRLRMPVSLLPEFSRLFSVPVDALLGAQGARGKRGPASRFQQQLERIRQLPRPKQRFVMEMLDTVLAQASR
jgi:transcriptional regulator with XRE-family HTH domain